jgi:hypothetical protein
MGKKKQKKTKREIKAEKIEKLLLSNPIDKLPEMYEGILEIVDCGNETLKILRTSRPGALDQSLLNRLKHDNRESIEIAALHRKQLSAWRKCSPLPDQEKLITRCETLLDEVAPLFCEIDKIVVSQVTIDDIMGMSDEEVAIKALSGELGDLFNS